MKTLHFNHEFHQHPLFSSHTKAASTCTACDKDNEGINYQCTNCRFWVHQQCASVTKFKTSDSHPHKLELIYSLPHSFLEDRWRFNCQVCRAKIQPHNWAYRCAGCRYFTHVHNCSDHNREIEEFDYEAALAVAVHLPLANEFVSLATLFFMETNQKEGSNLQPELQGTNDTEISRKILFLDPHETCHKCVRVLAAPCNKCGLCKYFLPKSPAELQDPLLFEGYYSMLKDTVENCKGFGMSLSKDESEMKISSSVLPRYVKHEGHSHVLSTTYIEATCMIDDGTWCDACQNFFSGYGFRCNICKFTLDTYCALLPRSISHRYDKKHPFKLTYYSIEGVDEYVCEICEKDITTMWFYHCEECDHSIHPRCIWNYHVKFGPFVNGGPGDVVLVPTTTNLSYDCAVCLEKDTSGCRYSLVLAQDYEMVHLECTSHAETEMEVEMDIERWLENEKESLRVENVATSTTSEEDDLYPQTDTS